MEYLHTCTNLKRSVVKMLFMTCVAHILPLCFSALDVDDLIDKINKKQSSWKAGKTWSNNESLEFLSGTIDESSNLTSDVLRELEPVSSDLKEIPPSFDASEKWPLCESIKKPTRQGRCGGCWAVATAAVITDRICITSKGKFEQHISSEDLLSCCEDCIAADNGCTGGYVTKAWEFWHNYGVVSGGPFNSNEVKISFLHCGDKGCKPYSEDSFLKGAAPKCKYICTNKQYNESYKDDKKFGDKTFILYLQSVESIQSEILNNGPVISVMKVYQDFIFYQEGVYSYQEGEFTGEHHAVKIIGWGMENHEEPYWLVVNSWGERWGEEGIFKIKRGDNECEIENMVFGSANSTHTMYKNAALRTFVFISFSFCSVKLEETLLIS